MSNLHEGESFPMAEREHEQESEIQILAPNGLGFGEGSISTTAQISRGELSREAIDIGLEIITTHPEVFVNVDVDAHDDGCGDGRPAAKVFRLIDSATGKVTEYFNRSRRRAKVFGGGLIAASSMWRTVSGNPDNGETVLGDRTFIAGKLKERGVEFGAHTDSHAKGDVSGCGAIDKYPLITANAVKYKENILGVLKALYGDEYADNEGSIEAAFGSYETLARQEGYFSNANGKATMDLILDEGAIVKELDKDHMEDFIVVNDIEGTTFDQRTLDRLLKERGVLEEAQAFVVDTWRGRMYADAVTDIALENLEAVDAKEVRKIAYADFLIRTLAVSATLTQNDLPVVGRVSRTKRHFALAA